VDVAERLSQLALFADLTPMQVEAIAHSFEESVFQADERVLRRGLSGGNFYVILEGEARATGTPVRSHLGAGDFCGEMGLLDGSTRSASILAETDVTAVKLPRKEFLDLVDRHSEIARALLADLAARVRRLETALREADVRLTE